MLKCKWALVGLFSILSTVPIAAAAENKKATMDTIYLPVGRLVLAPPVGVTAKRSAVAFPHSRHFGYVCGTCHHKWDGYAPVRGCMAAGCHDQIAPQKKEGAKNSSADNDLRYYKYAYHQNCISCHRRLAIERQKLEQSKTVVTESLPKTGPTGCIECHPRD
jgi:hypothetical protein